MTEEQLSNILKFMTTVDCSDEVRNGMLEMAATTLTADRLKDLVSDNVNTTAEANNQNAEIFKFTKQEILKMPQPFRKDFRTAGCVAHVQRRRSGKNSWNYMIRYRKHGYNILACSNNLEEAKQKFIAKLCEADALAKQLALSQNGVTQPRQTTATIIPQAMLPATINGVPATFDGFANYYFETFYKRKVVKETYRITLSNYKNHVLPHIGDVQLQTITPNKCQTLLDRLIGGDKIRTAENIVTLLNNIFNAAIKHGILTHNPMNMVFFTKHEREHGKALTRDEERKLLEVTAGTPYQLMFAVGLYTGMRPNEYKTAIIEGEFIVANNSKRKNGKIELKKIPITPMLKPYVNGITELHFVRLEQMRNKIKTVLPTHKLYDLRTTFYTRCQECGVAEVAIKKFVGHTLGGLADTYTDLPDEFLLKEGAKFNY